MRNKKREVSDIAEIEKIINSCKTCHLAMIDGDTPYVLPLSFGYELRDGALTLWFHGAKEGRKIDVLRKNARVCFEMCREGEPVYAEKTPCSSGYYYSCVHGFGTAEFVEDIAEKRRALSLLMERQADAHIEFTEAQASAVCVFKVTSTDFTGKRVPRPE